jgi:hypothetical protein
LGPVVTPHGIAQNVENAWQYSKVYPEHVSDFGEPMMDYWKWMKAGFENPRAVRYPMGKGRKPTYSYWNGECLSYIEARKKIYIPIYSKAVCKTEAFQKLKQIHESGQDMYLKDFDGYDHKALNMSYDDVINCETKKMGHAFVLAMLLEGYLDVKTL